MQHDPDLINAASPNNTDPSSPAAAGRKRKAGSTSRGVASLTPDQLAKKRANDREAQRAIRERTKHTIEQLERRIQELESQQPYQELQVVVRQKDAVQAENEEIRRRLASVMSIIQPVVGAQGLTDLATAAQHNVQVGLGQQSNEFQNNGLSQTDPYLNGHQNSRSYDSPETSTYPAFSTAETTSTSQWSASKDALTQQRHNLQKGLELSDSGERLSFNFLLDSLNQQQQNIQSQTQIQQPPGQTPNHSENHNSSAPSTAPSWTALPKNIAPTCPLDGLLLNFVQSRQQQPNDNLSAHLGHPTYPSVSSLLNPSATGHRTLDPLSQLMTDIISKFENICGIPEQVAVLYNMFMTMRWQTHPTQENFKRLPEWMHPTKVQKTIPHAAWIDHLPWPQMRDKIIASNKEILFTEWFIPFTSGLSVNWPYDPYDCFLSVADIEDPLINPVFERHFRRLENWSLGPDFAVAYPELAASVRISDDDGSSSKSRSHSSS